MCLVSNVPHPLRPSTHVPRSGFPAAQAEATVFGDTAFTHGPHLMALTHRWCHDRLSASAFSTPLCGVPGEWRSGSWQVVSTVLECGYWFSIDPLRSLSEKKPETCHPPKDENNRTTDSAARWRTWLQGRVACTPHLPVFIRTPDLRAVFPREIVCPWKQSQTNRVRETRVKYPQNYL